MKYFPLFFAIVALSIAVVSFGLSVQHLLIVKRETMNHCLTPCGIDMRCTSTCKP
jgi:hypothetical protein